MAAKPAPPKKHNGHFGNTYGADAAAFKRETAQRLRDARRSGLTIGKIVALSKGKLTENMIMDILDANRVPISTYRVLVKALDKAEAETT